MKLPPLLIASCLAAIFLGGCKVGQLPDPNDPVNGGPKAGDLLRKKMKQASDLVNERVGTREITTAMGAQIMQVQAGEELDRLKDVTVPDDKAWEFAEVALTAQRWADAKKYLLQAQKYNQAQIAKDPNDQDRYVNDTLRLAHAEAAMGDLDSAIKTTRSVFNAVPHWKWPILYAVYLEIVPAAEAAKPGHEVQLAQLIEAAIEQHKLAEGSMSNEREAAWVTTRNFHIRAAWYAAARLYQIAGKTDLFQRAQREGDNTPHPMQT